MPWLGRARRGRRGAAREGTGYCRLRLPGRLPLVGGSELRLRERPVGVSAFAAQRPLDARIAQPGMPEKQVHCQMRGARTPVRGKRPGFTLSAQQAGNGLGRKGLARVTEPSWAQASWEPSWLNPSQALSPRALPHSLCLSSLTRRAGTGPSSGLWKPPSLLLSPPSPKCLCSPSSEGSRPLLSALP